MKLEDRGTGDPVAAERVSSRFAPLDDPGIPASTLPLEPDGAGETWEGSGGNLAFEGRWQVSVVSELATESRVVPLELQVQGPSLFLSVAAFPGQPVQYTVQLPDNSFIRLTLEPAPDDAQRITVEFFHFYGDPRPVSQVVLTARGSDEVTRQLPLRRVDPSSFTGVHHLRDGPTQFTVIGRTDDDLRLYGTFDIEVDAG